MGLDEYEGSAGRVPDIVHLYKRGAEAFPTEQEITIATRTAQHPSILFYNWKPSPLRTWAEVADGAVDDVIARLAERLRSYPGRVFIAIHHEPENDQGLPGSGMTPTDYVAMYRHVVQGLRAHGVDNVAFVMNYMGFSRWADVVDDFYPGDDVVDWIAYDTYSHATDTSFADLANRPDGDWPGFYSWATAKAPDKPLMLAEWGVNHAEHRDPAALLADAAGVLERDFPRIRAVVYWDGQSSDPTFQVGLDIDTRSGRDFARAYSELARDPYFNATSTLLVP